MKRFFFVLAALSLVFFVSGSVNAWEACETSVETLEVAGVIEFTSSFCNCRGGDIITIEINPEHAGITIDSVHFVKVTPRGETDESYEMQASVGTTPDVRFYWVTDKTRTVHLWVYLSTGEHIGVNAHFLRD